MKILRFILSLSILVASGTWMSLNFLEQKFYDHKISWSWETEAPTAKAWELSTLVFNETEKELNRLKVKTNRSARLITARSNQKKKKLLEAIISNSNQEITIFDKHNKKIKENAALTYRHKQTKIALELETLQLLEDGFKALKLNNSSISLPQNPTEKKVDGKTEIPLTKPPSLKQETTSSIVSNTTKKVTISDNLNSDVNAFFNEFLENDGPEESILKYSEASDEVSNEKLMESILSLKTIFLEKYEEQNTKGEEFLKNINSIQSQYRTLLNNEKELLAKELITKHKDQLLALKNNLQEFNRQYFNTFSEQINSIHKNHRQNWLLFSNYIHQRKKELQEEKTFLAKLFLTKNSLNHTDYGKLTLKTEPSEAKLTDLKESYWRFMAGALLCLLFNFVWEIVAQRSQV